MREVLYVLTLTGSRSGAPAGTAGLPALGLHSRTAGGGELGCSLSAGEGPDGSKRDRRET